MRRALGGLTEAVAFLVVLALVATFISCSGAKPAGPPSRCANLMAHAFTQPYAEVTGSGACTKIPGYTVTFPDWLAQRFALYPPIYDRLDKSCGYYPSAHAFAYLAHNAQDNAAGGLIIVVDSKGYVQDGYKFAIRKAGEKKALKCP